MATSGVVAIIMSATGGRIRVNLLQPAADLIVTHSSGAKLYLDEGATQGGAFSATTDTALVSGTEQYEFADVTATAALWYKVRVGNTGGTVFSDYSPAVLHTSTLAYATLDDLRETFDTGNTRDNLLSDLLADMAAEIDSACGRRFHRDPQVTGTRTVYVDVLRPGRSSLTRASGSGFTTDGTPLDILSLTTLGVRDNEGDGYTTIVSGDTGYYLDPADGVGIAGTDWPYGDVSLSIASANFTTFPVGKRAVEMDVTLGFPAIPAKVKRANIDLAREAYRLGPGGGPSQGGAVNQFGVPLVLTGVPSFRTLMARGSPYVRRTYTSI